MFIYDIAVSSSYVQLRFHYNLTRRFDISRELINYRYSSGGKERNNWLTFLDTLKGLIEERFILSACLLSRPQDHRMWMRKIRKIWSLVKLLKLFRNRTHGEIRKNWNSCRALKLGKLFRFHSFLIIHPYIYHMHKKNRHPMQHMNTLIEG